MPFESIQPAQHRSGDLIHLDLHLVSGARFLVEVGQAADHQRQLVLGHTAADVVAVAEVPLVVAVSLFQGSVDGYGIQALGTGRFLFLFLFLVAAQHGAVRAAQAGLPLVVPRVRPPAVVGVLRSGCSVEIQQHVGLAVEATVLMLVPEILVDDHHLAGLRVADCEAAVVRLKDGDPIHIGHGAEQLREHCGVNMVRTAQPFNRAILHEQVP